MANKFTLKLTPEQQQQIKAETGKDITELNIEPAASGELRDAELDGIAGGRIYF